MQCKHEGCSNKRRLFEYSCRPCRRVIWVARIARGLLQEMLNGKDTVPGDVVEVAWELAKELVSEMDKELGYTT